jgi:hypothetical protein
MGYHPITDAVDSTIEALSQMGHGKGVVLQHLRVSIRIRASFHPKQKVCGIPQRYVECAFVSQCYVKPDAAKGIIHGTLLVYWEDHELANGQKKSYDMIVFSYKTE